MSQTITLALLLEETPYTPKPGLLYEIAEGTTVALKAPTYLLQEQVQVLIREYEEKPESHADLDIEIARLVTVGDWPEKEALYLTMPSRVSQDFFICGQKIAALLSASSAKSSTASPPPSEGKEGAE